jgi:hypothetical protein
MKNILRQITVILFVIATIAVNALANIIPFNGLNTGQISDRFQVYFVPAGYVFAIWGLIYIGLITYAVYQALPAQRDNPLLRSMAGPFILGSVANIIWLILWHYLQFPGTLLAMLILLASLITIYLRLNGPSKNNSTGETWLVRIPFSIYLGWITVATIANVTDLLSFLKWNGWGISSEIWMAIILTAVVSIASLMNFTRRDLAYSAVILWALAGIAVKFPVSGLVTISVWLSFGLVALTLVFAFIINRPVSQRI